MLQACVIKQVDTSKLPSKARREVSARPRVCGNRHPLSAVLVARTFGVVDSTTSVVPYINKIELIDGIRYYNRTIDTIN